MQVDYAALGPEMVVAGAACFVLLADLVLRGSARQLGGFVSFLALVAAGVLLSSQAGAVPRTTLSGMFVLDGFALVFKGVFIVVGALVVVLSLPAMAGHTDEGEYYFLLLSSVLGTMLMPSSRDLLMLFIALELVSVPAFVIAGLRKQDPRSNEAALKFFLFGVLSAAAFAYAISLVYGLVGTTDLAAINARLGGAPAEPLLLTAVVLIVAAFGFKVSAVPFHFWAPDTYEGSPVPLAAFLSVASKAAGFAGLALILVIGFPKLAPRWGPVVGAVAIATMTLGNVLALRQRHLVRLLAYSSIAQAGYMLIPLAVVRPPQRPDGIAANATDVVGALLVYVIVYAAMNIGAFSLAAGTSKQHPTLLVRDLAGLGRQAPLHALAMVGFLLSLGGIPPFAGWAGKFFIFLAAVNAHTTLGVVLAAVMVVNSVVSLYYYVGVVRAMYFEPARDEARVRFSPLVTAAVTASLATVVALGVLPETAAHVARTAAQSLR